MKRKEIVEEMIRQAIEGDYYIGALDTLGKTLDFLMDNEKPKEEWVLEKTGEVMHQIGVTYQNMGEFLPALLQLKQAKCFRMDNNDIVGYAFTCSQIAMCRLARGDPVEDVLPDFETAKEAIEKAIPELQKREDYKKVGDMGRDLAYIAQRKGEITEAIDLYWTAFRIYDEQGDKRGKALTYARLAQCYALEGENAQKEEEIANDAESFYEARKYAYYALEIFEAIPDKKWIKLIKELLGEIALLDRRLM